MKNQNNFILYKKLKTRDVLKKENVTFIANFSKPAEKNWINLKNDLNNKGLKVTQVSNTELKRVLNSSIFSMYTEMSSGSMAFITPEKEFSAATLLELKTKVINNLSLVGIVLNGRLYLPKKPIIDKTQTLIYGLKKDELNLKFSVLLKTFTKLIYFSKLKSKQRDSNT